MTVVVGSYRGSPWLSQCLDSIPSRWETIVVRNGGYECSALSWVMEKTNIHRFLFLQDSTKINDPSWMEEAAAFNGSVSLNYEPGWFGSFLGVYRREILEKCSIPWTPDKMSAVLAEMTLGREYELLEPNRLVLWPELKLSLCSYAVVHGREVAVYENQFFTKYKSTFSGDGITPSQERDDAHKLLYP